jgi:hypothetical protein
MQADTGAQNGYGHHNANKPNGRQYGNPAYKKNWQQKSRPPVQNEVQNNNSQNYQESDRRRKNNNRENRPMVQGPQHNEQNNANGTNDNGFNGSRTEQREQRRNDEYYRRNRPRRDREFNYNNQNQNQVQSAVNPQPSQEQVQEQQPVQTAPTQNGTTAPNAPAHQHPSYPPHLETRIDESRRISELIGAQQPQVTPQEMQLVEQVKEVVPHCSHEDIYHTLQQFHFDKQKTISALLGEDGIAQQQQRNLAWSEVVKKRLKNITESVHNMQNMPNMQYDRRPRQDRGGRARAQQQRANNTDPGQSPDTQQEMSFDLIAGGEDMILGLSKAIEAQLAEIANKTRMLLNMKAELETIHMTGKDQLSTLQNDKAQLVAEREQLLLELRNVEERLHHTEVAIEKAEKDKLLKLKDLQRKSITHGLLATSNS